MAQTPSGALLFSNQDPVGTARTQALGGVSIGLGGDYSSAYSNPAGIGFFKTGEFLISGGVGITGNTSTYFPMAAPEDKKGSRTNFQVPNIGVIFASNRNSGANTWNNFSFAVGMNRLANFNNNINIGGVTSTTSITENWIDDMWAAGMDPRYASSIGASLAWDQKLISTFTNSKGETDLISQASPARQIQTPNPLTAIYQRANIQTRGGINDYNFAMGANYGDRLYIGGSIDFPNVNYKEDMHVSEDDNDSQAKSNNFGYLDYNQYTRMSGLGFSASLGLIYKVADRFRVGASFHLPTWYSLNVTQSGDLTTNTENWNGVQSGSAAGSGYLKDFSYNLRTPFRAGAGASYFFGNLKDPKSVTGFIAADYEYVNHSSSKYNYPDYKASQDAANAGIKQLFTNASNFRVGAEVKFLSLFAVRAGYAQTGNPYSGDNYNMKVDASRKTYSGGVGLRTKGIYVDLTYSYTQTKDYYQLYTTEIADLYPPAAMLDYTRSNIMATVGFKF
ncbi:OmpP1/FadL family transporter [Chitinophaga sp. Hz27]|uniref:OmpP1/FadL family transporter n=1 Tax=Chitinophaga sp. Hz27 TaxID=3347169 RepID=UPI0035D67C25